MDAEAVANRSSYWKLAAALQSFLLLLQRKDWEKKNEPEDFDFRTSLKRPRKTPSVFLDLSRVIETAQNLTLILYVL